MVRSIRLFAAVGALVLLASGCSASEPSGRTSAGPPSPSQRPAPLWTADVGGHPSAVAVNDGVVYVMRREGGIVAFPSDCSSSRCTSLWSGTTGPVAGVASVGSNGLTVEFKRPVVGGGQTYVLSRDLRTLWGFDTACSSTTCDPSWIARSDHPITAVVPTARRVYVASWKGDVAAYPADCGSRKTCDPVWRSSAVAPSWHLVLAGDRLFAPGFDARLHALDASTGVERWRSPSLRCLQCLSVPVVDDGTVFVTTPLRALIRPDPSLDTSLLFSYPTGCASRECHPSWSAQMDDLLPSAPVVGDGRVFVSSESYPGSGDGDLYAFPTSCDRSSRCPQSWVAPTLGETGIFSPTYADGVVVTVSQEQGIVEAFPSDCRSSTCERLWFNLDLTGPMVPVVAQGVVYIATNDGRLLGFDLHCRTDGKACEPSFELSVDGDGILFTQPAVSGGTLYTTTTDGQLLAYRVSGESRPSR